jgi:hypothetical protein
MDRASALIEDIEDKIANTRLAGKTLYGRLPIYEVVTFDDPANSSTELRYNSVFDHNSKRAIGILDIGGDWPLENQLSVKRFSIQEIKELKSKNAVTKLRRKVHYEMVSRKLSRFIFGFEEKTKDRIVEKYLGLVEELKNRLEFHRFEFLNRKTLSQPGYGINYRSDF